MALQEIITETVKRGIPVELRYNKELESIEYIVSGFSKSGTATVLQTPANVVFALTRYEQSDCIETFKDLATVAFNWYLNYSGREPFTQPSSYWAETFVEYGWLQKKTEQVVTYY